MEYSFTAYGHRNIIATHKTTLEFTKDSNLTLNGDCIVGINSNFDFREIKHFIKNISGNNNKNITIIIKIKANGKKFSEKFFAFLNPLFDDGKEVVIRKSNFVSKRTFAIRSEKGAIDLSREFVGHLRNPNQKIEIGFIIS